MAPFAKFQGRFRVSDAQNGNFYVWHVNVLGFVVCCTISKKLGIGAAERSWSNVNQIKDRKKSNTGESSLKKG